MKALVLLTVIVLSGCSSTGFDYCSDGVPYVKFGASYKQYENPFYRADENGNRVQQDLNPIGGRFETGLECGSYNIGYYHSSDLFTGKPFNNSDKERVRDEFFVDYIIRFE
jgi:hypothetical protein